MDGLNDKALPADEVEMRSPWHKPQVERLTVSLDTRDGNGSSQDSYVFTGPAGIG
jgi:hypothetical protein